MSIASVLALELLRIARKEVRGETLFLKKAVDSWRREVVALRRRTEALEKEVIRQSRSAAHPAAEEGPLPSTTSSTRFSPKGFASRRRRLGLSARDCGLLIGASSQSIYNWEAGKARPQGKHSAAINAFYALGKRKAAARLREVQRARASDETARPEKSERAAVLALEARHPEAERPEPSLADH